MPSPDVSLREVVDDDVPVFFEHQRDPEANRQAAFTARDPEDRSAFDAHWERIRNDASMLIRTIEADAVVAGYVAHFHRGEDTEVCYWLGKDHWGQGIATQALREFLFEVPLRPLVARAAADNIASLRVLEKCGFVTVTHETSFAGARGEDIQEAVMRLDG